jgi:hypothetical protein
MQIYGYLLMAPHLLNISPTVNLNYPFTFELTCAITRIALGFYFLHFPYLHLGTRKIIYGQHKTELVGPYGFFWLPTDSSSYQKCKSSCDSPKMLATRCRICGHSLPNIRASWQPYCSGQCKIRHDHSLDKTVKQS